MPLPPPASDRRSGGRPRSRRQRLRRMLRELPAAVLGCRSAPTRSGDRGIDWTVLPRSPRLVPRCPGRAVRPSPLRRSGADRVRRPVRGGQCSSVHLLPVFENAVSRVGTSLSSTVAGAVGEGGCAVRTPPIGGGVQHGQHGPPRGVLQHGVSTVQHGALYGPTLPRPPAARRPFI